MVTKSVAGILVLELNIPHKLYLFVAIAAIIAIIIITVIIVATIVVVVVTIITIASVKFSLLSISHTMYLFSVTCQKTIQLVTNSSTLALKLMCTYARRGVIELHTVVLNEAIKKTSPVP